MRTEDIRQIQCQFDETDTKTKLSRRINEVAEKRSKSICNMTRQKKAGRKCGTGRATNPDVVSYIGECYDTISTLQNKEVQAVVEKNCGVVVSESMISRIKTKMLRITFKKASLISRQRLDARVLTMREKFKRMITKLPIECIISADECHIEMSDVSRQYGHSRVGTRAQSFSQRVVKLRYTLIMFVPWNHGVFYYELIDTTHKAVDQQRFDDCMKRMNQTRPRHMIVQLDNASVHGNVQVPVIWQSPYSPDLNPIEKVFGLLKARMKGYEYSTDTLRGIVEKVVASLSITDIRAFFTHCSRL